MRHRSDAGLLELLRQLDEVLPGRGLGAADLVEQRLVHPDPVGRVHVEGCRDIVAVILVDGLQRRRDHLVPAVLLRQRRQVAQSTLLGPVLDHQAQHLHGGRRVAGGHAGLQHGAGLVAAAARDRGVLPGDALLLEVAAQHLQGRRLAAGGPPMDDLDLFGRARLGRAQRQADHGGAGEKEMFGRHALRAPYRLAAVGLVVSAASTAG